VSTKEGRGQSRDDQRRVETSSAVVILVVTIESCGRERDANAIPSRWAERDASP
jgi:hypothetical protein